MVKLQVYVKEECWACAESHRIVAEIAPLFPQISIEMLDMAAPSRPPSVFAVPTYVLNGRIISLGNPFREDLRQEIKNAISSQKT